MFDLHTHTFFSDGVLIPSELVRRYAEYGYKGVVLSDHVDFSNIDSLLPQIVSFCTISREQFKGITVLPGCELTHIPPQMIPAAIAKARALGAKLVIVHGETIVEPVLSGTNRAAIEGGADLLAHPGLITKDDALLAAHKGVALEVTSRAGHSYSNGHVVQMALESNAKLVYSSDFHEPHNVLRSDMVHKVLMSAGLKTENVQSVLKNTEELFFKAQK
jgi:histidinol phosphatase-like PHP family hydrolase